MFDIGLQEMVLIGVIALLVFGPSKLPELGRMFGRAMREFRRASDEFRSTVETNLQINDPEPTYSATTSPPVPTEPTATDTSIATLPSEIEAAQSGEPAVAVETPSEAYCAQRGSRLFHRRECAWVTRMPEADRIYMKTVADARDQGFSTCPVCEPWEPA
ncbi:MAG: twin-arginine translocase TatA/TatE family subunit [Candidatus Rokubacteria bacterium]|nr:twin-arginine translocase TatA/TatE family subunit [Candidatus Rokubacteria bacterium]